MGHQQILSLGIGTGVSKNKNMIFILIDQLLLSKFKKTHYNLQNIADIESWNQSSSFHSSLSNPQHGVHAHRGNKKYSSGNNTTERHNGYYLDINTSLRIETECC